MLVCHKIPPQICLKLDQNRIRNEATARHAGGNSAGSVVPDKPDESIFDQPWHKRVLGLTIASGAMGKWSIDTSRFWRETLPKSDYESFTYYEKWLAALTNLFVVNGLVSRDEIARGSYEGPQQPLDERALKVDDVQNMLATGSRASRPATGQPAFSIGQIVKTRQPSDTILQEPGHTRLPHYVAEKIRYYNILSWVSCPAKQQCAFSWRVS